MDCTSKASKLCIGEGQKLWGGMCSNCADYVLLPQHLKERQDRQNEREEKRLLSADPDSVDC